MKKILSFLFCVILVFTIAVPCFCAEPVRVDNKLSEKESSYLDTLFETIKKTYGIEAFFVINYDYSSGSKFKDYARKYLDDNAQTEDAVVFAVSSDSYYMNARGRSGELLTDDDLDVLYSAIADEDENGEQYRAAVQFYKKLLSVFSERTAAENKPDPSSQAAPDAPTETATEPVTERVIVPGSVDIPDEISPTRGDRLVDQADLLSEQDEAALQEKLDTLSEHLQFDIVIVTAEHIGNRTPMEFADDYFDYNGFGYGENYDGVALLISMEERDWWISTCGYGMTALSDDYFMNIISPSDLTYNLKKGNYSDAFNFFADTVSKFVTEAKTNQPYSSNHHFHYWGYIKIGLIWSVIIGLIAAAITAFYVKSSYVGYVSSKTEANDYLVGNVILRLSRDDFRYSKVYREKRVETTSSSSSSSSSRASVPGHHTSSSGRTHGGGGGKF